MTRILGSLVLSLALLGSTFVSAPDAQTQIQRGYGPTIAAGSGGATAGISSVLTVSTTTAQTGANTTETDLWTYSLPANTLSADGYTVRISAWGTVAANGNGKTIRVYFGSAEVGAATGTTSNGIWNIRSNVFRTGATSQLVVSDGRIGIAATANASTRFDLATPSHDLATAATIKVTGQNSSASAGDIVFRGAVVEFLRAGS